MSDDAGVDDRSSLVDGVAYLSLCASGTTDATSEPYYVGSSSGATIARVIQQSIFKGAGNRRISEAATASDQQYAETMNSSTPPTSVSAHSESLQLGLPDLDQARMLFDMFFERIHTRWPLLDRVVYEDLFAKQHIPGALTIVERSIFHLIYAITARFMSLTRKLHSVDSEVRISAMTCYIQSSVLTSIAPPHGSHRANGPYSGAAQYCDPPIPRTAWSTWTKVSIRRGSLVTDQVRHVDVHRNGLAQESCPNHHCGTSKRGRNSSPNLLVLLLPGSFHEYCAWSRIRHLGQGHQRRSKCFILGSPERGLTLMQLPSAGGQFWTLTHSEPRNPSHGPWSNVEPFIHIIKLDQINSRTHKAVFRVDRDVFKGTPEQRAKLDRKMATIRADLDDWMRTCPQTPKEGNKITWMYDPESAYLDARDFYGV